MKHAWACDYRDEENNANPGIEGSGYGGEET